MNWGGSTGIIGADVQFIKTIILAGRQRINNNNISSKKTSKLPFLSRGFCLIHLFRNPCLHIA